jgi:AbrB family looped-hinge helix DNA binding protein
MSRYATLSTKGQVVIPKDVRDELGWQSGADLELTQTLGGVVLKAVKSSRRRISADEFDAIVRPHVGPIGDDAKWRAAVDADFGDRLAESEC